MARRIKSTKRKYLGHRTYGGGNTKNRRGKGSKGGKGRGGFHKHKWLQTIKRGEHKPENKGIKNGRQRADYKVVTLENILESAQKGAYAKEGDALVANLAEKSKKIKVLGNGAFALKANVTAHAFSKSAKEKIEKAGGKAIIKE